MRPNGFFSVLLLVVLFGLPACLAGCPAEREAGDLGRFAGIVFVWCPPGTFPMGRMPGEELSDASEEPRHEVTIEKGFWMSRCEITQGQWEAVIGNNPSNFLGSTRRPVETVSWNDVQGFITTLNFENPDMTFRLPTEAEWEYACRAGTTTRFYWGDDPNLDYLADYAWFTNNSLDKTHDVAGKSPNAWGLCDMIGNVGEWCQDYWHDDYTNAPTDGSAWEEPAGTDRVTRGGNFGCTVNFLRSAARTYAEPGLGQYSIGFRLVKEE